MLSEAIDKVFDPRVGLLMPERMASTLNVAMADIARMAHVHRNTLANAPESPKVQARLGEIVRILAEAADLMGGSVAKAALWFRHQPLSGFDGETAEELVTAGHAAAVRAHLKMLRDGSYA